MNVLPNGGHPLPAPEFLKERKFLLVVPLLVLPFLIMGFWALGGGKGSFASLPAAGKGLNTSLPQAQLKNLKSADKMSIYQTIKADASGSASDGVSESFIRSMGQDGAKLFPADSGKQHPVADLTRFPSSTEISEAKIQAKLAQINQQINQPSPENYTLGTAQPEQSGSDNKCLQLMMKAVNSNTGVGNDPEIRQLTELLKQIGDIQNPENAIDRVRNRSLKNHRQVYPVTAAANDDNSNTQFPVQYFSDRGAGENEQRTSFATNRAEANTIQAVVHNDQTLVSGAVVKLRLEDGVYISGRLVPKGSFVYGTCTLNNERLDIKITTIRYLNNILPVSLSVYDLDGMQGLYVPGSIGRDAAKNGMGDAVQSMQLLSLGQSIGTQAASAGIDAAKGLFGHKVRQIKVKVKAGYQVLLKDSNDQDI